VLAPALPTLLTTASRSLPPQRFATGGAVVTMARQVGTVLGVAILIVILDSAADDVVGSSRGNNPPRTDAA
jgi:hypothetical protein